MSNKRHRHLVIPDTQIRHGRINDHCRWAGLLAAEYDVTHVIHLGDHYDMESVSTYASPMEREGLSIQNDIDAGDEAIRLIEKPLFDQHEKLRKHRRKSSLPELHFIHGNHEYRLNRFVAQHPQLARAIGTHKFSLDNWKQHIFLDPLKLNDVSYAHFFCRSRGGRVMQSTRGAASAEKQIKQEMCSCTSGHRQGFDYAQWQTQDRLLHGVIAGSSYVDNFDYLTPQGSRYWRGIIIKNDVFDGEYDLHKFSLHELCLMYEQMELSKFIDEKYGEEVKYARGGERDSG